MDGEYRTLVSMVEPRCAASATSLILVMACIFVLGDDSISFLFTLIVCYHLGV